MLESWSVVSFLNVEVKWWLDRTNAFFFPCLLSLKHPTILTFVQVVVLPLPCRPTNMMTLGLFFVGAHGLTPGSRSCDVVGEDGV